MLDLVGKERLVRLLVATAEVIGDEVRPAAAALMVEDLSVYRMPVVEKALAACRRELKGRLSLAAILERIDDGHPTPNEAWAMAVPAADERNTVVWTGEMADAWATALPLVRQGDMVAARMAFIEVYGRLLKAARVDRRQANYRPSLGFDAAGRDAALRAAAAKGLLPSGMAESHMVTSSESLPQIAELAERLALPRVSSHERDCLDALPIERKAMPCDEEPSSRPG